MRREIVVVGLGFGDEKSLTLGTLDILENSENLWLRTGKHPITPWLRNRGVSFSTFDSIYDSESTFSSVYHSIVDRLLSLAHSSSPVVYAVPGHPMVAEKAVQLLLENKQEVKITIHGGGSFLDIAFSRLKIDPIEGFMLFDGSDLDSHRIDPYSHLLLGQVYNRFVASEVKLSLMEVYPDDHPVVIGIALGVINQEKIIEVPLVGLDRLDVFNHLSTVYVRPIQTEEALYRRFSFLEKVIEKLRSPQGCPWDQQQTHLSLRPYLIEEAYELLQALENDDVENMIDELGDVLLQVLLHAQIEKELGSFSIYDVIDHLTRKMIRRHPHVFGEESLKSIDEVVERWNEIKKQEKSTQFDSLLETSLNNKPGILRAFEQQKIAAKVGFDWKDKEGVRKKVIEEMNELFEASSSFEQEEELGDLLYVIMSLARHYHIHPEVALIKACNKFEKRFHYIEDWSKKNNRAIKDLSENERDKLWEMAKDVDKP